MQPNAQPATNDNVVAVNVPEGALGHVGIGSLGQMPAVLSWGANIDSPIVLTKESGEVIFSALPKDFQKFYVEFNTINLTVNKKNFLLYARTPADDAVYTAGILAAGNAGMSIASGSGAFSAAGIDSLKKLLAESGAKTNKRNPLMLGLMVFGIGFGILVALVLIITVIATFS